MTTVERALRSHSILDPQTVSSPKEIKIHIKEEEETERQDGEMYIRLPCVQKSGFICFL